MKFKVDCFFPMNNIYDHETFELVATDPKNALNKAKKKYPKATNINLKQIK